jgi:hypothetical protein
LWRSFKEMLDNLNSNRISPPAQPDGGFIQNENPYPPPSGDGGIRAANRALAANTARRSSLLTIVP